MKILQVTAHLAHGFAAADPWSPALDAVLGYEALRRRLGPAFYSQDPHRDGLIEPELPLARRGTGDDWYWAVSWPQYREAGQYLKHWHKRFDDQHAEAHLAPGKARKVNTQSGVYKTWRMPLVCRLAPEIAWWCVGDPAGISALLAQVTHLGKKHAQGSGAVLRWEVEEIADDWSERRDGGLTRAVPLSALGGEVPDGAEVAELAIRPPYWWQGHRRTCAVPG